MNAPAMATAVKTRITVEGVLRRYGYSPSGKNRVPCPIHHGDGYNMAFNETRYHCFVCGESGDVIALVQKMFDLSFHEAIQKLNEDFCLGLPLEGRMSLREQRRLAKAHAEYTAEQQRRREERERQQARYKELWDAWAFCDICRREYAPATPEETLHPLFVYALHNMERLEYEIDALAVERSALSV